MLKLAAGSILLSPLDTSLPAQLRSVLVLSIRRWLLGQNSRGGATNTPNRCISCTFIFGRAEHDGKEEEKELM